MKRTPCLAGALIAAAVLSLIALWGDQITPSGSFSVKDDAYTFSDVATGNASTTAHGLLLKLNNNSAQFLDGTGAWSTPAGGVPSSRAISTTSPITGGGDLSADRTFALDFTVAYTHTGNGIGSTPADRVTLANTTAAAAGAQQWSPALRFTGQGWKTTATAASQAVDWRIQLQPVQGSTAPTANLLLDYAVNGGAFGTKHTFGSDGTYVATSNIQAGNGTVSLPSFRFATGGNSGMFWNGSSWVGIVYNGTETLSVTSAGVNIASGTLNASGGLIVGGGTLTKMLTATAVLDFPSTLTLSDSDLTVSVANAALGDTVALGIPNGSIVAGGDFFGWVSSAGVVTIRFSNHSAGSLDPASGTFRATVLKF